MPDGLVDEIPDESALITRLAVGELRVLVHAAAAVAHGVRVFAANERFLGMLGEELLDAGNRRVHLAFHVARAIIAAIPENVFVMHEAARIDAAEELAHLVDDLAAARLVAARPDDDGRMVLVALEHGIRAVDERGLPFVVIVRHDEVGWHMDAVLLPAAVRLHVRLVNDIESIDVSELIDAALVRVVRRAQRIDVIALHRDDVLLDLFRVDGTAAIAIELMTVHALEDDALAVDLHQAIFHFEFAEADVLRDDLDERARRIADFEQCAIEIRMLGAPELRVLDLERERRLVAVRRRFRIGNGLAVCVVERQRNLLACGLRKRHIDREFAVFVVMLRHGMDEEVAHMRLRLRDELHLAEQAGKTPEVLILDPTRGREAHDGHGELVLARDERIRDVERRRRERVLAVADVLPVDVDDERRLRTAELHEDALAVPRFRHSEIPHIRADGIVFLRDLAGLHVLMAVPRIRHVRVLRHAVAFHLQVPRHADGLPVAAVVIERLEADRTRRYVFRVTELPEPVEAPFERALPFRELGEILVRAMVAVRRDAVLCEERRVGELSPIECVFHFIVPP